MSKKMLLTVVLLVVALAGGGAAWWWTRGQAADEQPWRTAKIARGNITAAVAASGTINPVASVIVGSQVSGQLAEVLVDFNSPVKAGQVVARLDPQTFEQAVRQAQADLDAARAQVAVQQAQVDARRADISRAEVNLAEAQLDLSRKEQLVERGFISSAERDKARAVARAIEQDLNAARATLQVAQAQVRNAEATASQREAALASSRIALARTIIRSPVNGVVIKRAVEPGQTVAASLQAPELFVIAQNLRDMQVDTAIDESDVGRMRQGQRATFTVDAFPGRTFEGVVEQVRKAATNVQNVVTYNVVVTFQNPGGQLLPGMTANVRIATETREGVLMVPNAALRFRPPADLAVASGPRTAGALDKGGAGGAGAVAAGEAGAPVASGASGGPGGAQMAAFRERLERELELTPAQRERIGAIFTGMRESFAGIRGLPEDQRARAGQAARAELRAKIAEVLTPAQRPKYDAIVAESAGRAGGAAGGRGRIHLVVEEGLRAVEVRTGATDGVNTEIMGTGLAEGQDAVLGRVGGNAPARPPGPPRLF